MKKSIFTLFILHFALLSFSQTNLTNELNYEVNFLPSPFSLNQEQLTEVQTIVDLNKHYKSSWIREFITVEVSAIEEGKEIVAIGKNDTFTRAQKDLMTKADAGSTIKVEVKYIPENNLSHNDAKNFSFTFIVNPENEAEYIGGAQKLNQYLKKSVIDKIPTGTFEGYDLSAIKFTIDEEGKVTDAYVFWPYQNEETDELLLAAICNMPNWKPATYANGKQVKQEFAFTVGNHENCAVNLLNIKEIEE